MEEAAPSGERVIHRVGSGVRVAGPIGVAVVATVVGDPADDRALERHRSEHRQRHLERPARLEAAVGEQAVVADGHPVRDHEVEDREQDEVEPGHRLTDRLARSRTTAVISGPISTSSESQLSGRRARAPCAQRISGGIVDSVREAPTAPETGAAQERAASVTFGRWGSHTARVRSSEVRHRGGAPRGYRAGARFVPSGGRNQEWGTVEVRATRNADVREPGRLMELRRFGELFAELARPVVDGADGVGARLCVACVELLEVGAVGILLVDDDGAMSCFATSGTAPVGVIEDLQFTLGKARGSTPTPAVEPVLAADLAHPSSAQWSAFAPAALRQRGVRHVQLPAPVWARCASGRSISRAAKPAR